MLFPASIYLLLPRISCFIPKFIDLDATCRYRLFRYIDRDIDGNRFYIYMAFLLLNYSCFIVNLFLITNSINIPYTLNKFMMNFSLLELFQSLCRANSWVVFMILPNFAYKFVVVLKIIQNSGWPPFHPGDLFTFFPLGLVHSLHLPFSDLLYFDCLLQKKICIQLSSLVKCVRILIYPALYLLFIHVYIFVSPTGSLAVFLPILIKRKKFNKQNILLTS